MGYWRLSFFYFFYFAILGTFIPFWGLLLKQQGLSGGHIAGLLGIFIGTRVFAPYVLAWIADVSGRTSLLIKLSSLLLLASFYVLFNVENFVPLIFASLCAGFFFSAILPKFEAVTLKVIPNPEHYSRVRLWGSVGFLIAVMACGKFFDLHGMEHLETIVLILCLGIVVISMFSSISAAPWEESHVFTSELRNPALALILVISFLQQLSHGAYYSYFSVFLELEGFDKTAIGNLWGLGVVAEIVVFVILPQRLKSSGFYGLLLISMALTAVRWLGTAAWADSALILSLMQILHAASFALFHVLAVLLVNSCFSAGGKIRGQAIYSMASFGAGIIAGSLATAGIIEYISHEAVFYLSAIPPVIGFLLLWVKGKKLLL